MLATSTCAREAERAAQVTRPWAKVTVCAATRSPKARIVGGDQRRVALLRALRQQRGQRGDALHVEAVGGLVEDEERGIAREGREQASAAALPDERLPRRCAEEARRAEALNQAGSPPARIA